MAKLINGNGNPAIYAAEDADLIASLAGNVTCIANVGNKYAATEEDATTIRLDDGVIITKEGRRIQLEAGESDTFYIPTGTSGQTNYYIIGYKLVQNADSTQVAEQFVQKMNSSSETITEDTFRSGATEVYVSVYRVTQVGFTIDSISGLLPELLDNASIKDNIDQINSDLALRSTFNYNKRNIICIGDSYGQFVQGSSVSWISYLKDYAYNLGEFYHNELGGAGFLANLYSPDGTYKSFQDLLEMLENEIENPNNITDIIVCGGYNDLSAGHEYIAQLQSKMLSFKQYVNTHYPNARIYVGMIGRSTEMHICKSLITETYLYYSNACHNLGLIYLSGVETCVKSDTHMRDNVHPDNSGSITIGESILQLINGANKLYAPTITGSDISNTDATVSSLVTLYNTSNGIDIKFSEGSLTFNSITEITYNQSNVITIGTITNQFGHVFNYQFGTTIDVKIVDTSYNFKSAIGYLYIEDRTLKLKISCLDGNNWATINTRQLLLGYGVISVAKHYY